MDRVRALMIAASEYDTTKLLSEWRWIVPQSATPLFISVFGDWVFGHPDGSLALLSVLEGSYGEVARNAAEYDTLNKSADWLKRTFLVDWQVIAAEHGLQPANDECVGWRLHPLLGGRFEVGNMQLFKMSLYQSLMGQLHRQWQQPCAPTPPRPSKTWFRLKAAS